MRQRRFLPSLSQLLAFEAVMRHQSVTAAANELHLTQSTVSRLIQSLEEQLGKELFSRQRKRLIPNAEAAIYRADVTRGLDIIQRASMSLIANPGGGTLSLSVLPTFATRWLAPQLGGFLEQNPGISFNLSTKIQRFSFLTESFDAAIYFGDEDWPDVRHLKLFGERLTACASPAFLDRHPVEDIGDMKGLPLLQLETRPNGWRDWFLAHGLSDQAASGMMMDQFSMMIQAAISGLGIALLPHYLARTEIGDKRLLPVLTPSIPATGAYWLVWPETKNDYAPLTRFRTWIASLGSPGDGA
ncbi:MAG: LysR family transcriptional regulator [Silicimonas sp.]